ncbi:DUF4333 domain-containing protein [Pseudonocardia bannensis]|uniref:DUF4333 domain-containing protein n=1 Tax=Pseudonocardia bannensis TaxID=630973 RepID=A0A848DNB2_9PSEU|nr:DUF4333 domain-containing protein [Pseudonocardia bannensis]NMH93854.1 DUF4333 domain-containing protein [Pseudonocardia bannensis]
MVYRIGRVVAAAGAAAALLFGLAGCSASVPKEDVASSISSELGKQGIQAQNVTCPQDLNAEVGRSVRCEFQVDGQPVDAVATVSSLEGDTAKFDITTEARPVAKAVLEREVGKQVEQIAQATPETVSCAGDLPAEVGKTTPCTVTAQGEALDLTVTVTEVDGGRVNFSIESTG